ncbi:hypothetical protein LMH87_001303 [Akanthomyces muscarius]|uniref:Uncharacterized protein n=1 Tax=Akanthomyces muscarius TaxID=2231603 RepID=A0A9W8QG97_AKAMU|nr:hypothetical protein LMH87_001303 [Akanthomyces muscarius]KAJ4156089.1 hypothetical protein LMH87_001303 [Akanthomyces muscarius]
MQPSTGHRRHAAYVNVMTSILNCWGPPIGRLLQERSLPWRRRRLQVHLSATWIEDSVHDSNLLHSRSMYIG